MRNLDPDDRDRFDTALNAGQNDFSREESAQEYESRRDAEMAQFQQLIDGG